MIKVGIIGKESLPSFKRRFGILLKNTGSIYFELAKKNIHYDIVLTSNYRVKALTIYSFNMAIYDNPNNLKAQPMSWMTPVAQIRYKLKSIYMNMKYKQNLKFFKAIVTGSYLQSTSYKKFNKTVYYLTDPISDDLIINDNPKKEFIDQKVLNIGLESGGLNVFTILKNIDFVQAIHALDNIKLHIVIDDHKLSNKYQIQNIHDALEKEFGNKVVLYEWSQDNFIKLFKMIDIAVIPVDMNEEFANSKPSNRPSIMMANYLPVICTPIGSYIDDLSQFNTCFFANTSNQWIEKINYIRKNFNILNDDLNQNAEQVRQIYSELKFIKKYENILISNWN